MKIKLNYYPQYKDYSCGPIALKMVFEHLGIECTREELIALCEAMPKIGTDHGSLIEAAEKQEDLVAKTKSASSIDDILCLLESGYPVIVNYKNPLGDHGHYSVVSGYDADDELLIFADPANGKDYSLSYQDFETAWCSDPEDEDKWLMVVGRERILTTNCDVF